jgi:hypothetical protein
MFSLKKYINSVIKDSIKDSIKDEVIQSIKAEVMKEILESKEYKLDLKQYKMKTLSKEKLNIWTAMQTLDIYELEIETKHKLNNGVIKDRKLIFKTLSELNEYIKKFKFTEFSDDEIAGFTNITFYVWYKYKSEKRQLVAEHFINSNNNVYEFESILKIFKELENFIDKHPELII